MCPGIQLQFDGEAISCFWVDEGFPTVIVVPNHIDCSNSAVQVRGCQVAPDGRVAPALSCMP